MRKILALLALCFAQYVGGIREGNFRSNFFKTLPKHRMTGHVIKTVTASSQLLCAQKCLAHDACKSCNFRTSGDHYKICELNSRGLLSQAHDPDLAHDEVFLFIYVENEPSIPIASTIKDRSGSFKLFQTFPTSDSSSVTTFVISDELFLANTNMRGTGGSRGRTKLSVYLLQQNNLVINQTLDTLSASDVEYFTIQGEHFLAVANRYDGSSYSVDSVVYRLEAGQFKEFQRIRTSRAIGLSYFAVSERKFLIITNYGTDLISIYEWKTGRFIKIQVISLTNPYRCGTFNINNTPHFACGRGLSTNAVSVFRWSGSQFELFQQLSSKSVYSRPNSFNDNGTLYLAIGNFGTPYDTDSYIYRWDGAQFVHHQSIPTHGASDWDSFTTGEGDVFLIVANKKTGGSDGYHVTSAVYKKTGNMFNLHQQLKTTGASRVHAFTHKGKQYLAVMNQYNGSIYNLDSQVYIWD